MKSQPTLSCAHIDVRGVPMLEVWRVARDATTEPVALELAPYFVDTAEGRCDLEQLPSCVRVLYSSHAPAIAEARLDRFVRRLRSQ